MDFELVYLSHLGACGRPCCKGGSRTGIELGCVGGSKLCVAVVQYAGRRGECPPAGLKSLYW